VPKGPLWASLQRGENITLDNGNTVESVEVMGEPRRGRKFSYVTDTRYLTSIAGYVDDSDLFICEGMFMDELGEDANEKRHLTAKQAATIARDAGGIGKMGLIHYSPRYTRRDLKRMLEEAQQIFPDTFLTRDQQLIEIPYKE
jgi:ribonuclease Z